MNSKFKSEKLTIQRVLADESLRQTEFPVSRNKIFLAHAAVCPLPHRVASAMWEYLEQAQTGDQEEIFKYHSLLEIRRSAARLINARPDEIALIGPTSVALSIISAGLNINPGDTILIYYDDYPSNVYPWKNLEQKGALIKKLHVHEIGKITVADVLNQVDNKTRLVALSSCHFLSGWRVEIDKIGLELRTRGILFCVDGIQTIGAFPTYVDHVDFLAADAHKWMLGPCGAGILYVRRELLNQLNPILIGWHNARCPGFVALDKIMFHQDARKFEAGTHPLAILAGLKASLDLIHDVGIENIATELLRKRKIIIDILNDLGCEPLCSNSPSGNQSGIVAFTIPNLDMTEIHKTLFESGIVTSLRQDRNGTKYIRISPHFYNTDDELIRFSDTLRSIIKNYI